MIGHALNLGFSRQQVIQCLDQLRLEGRDTKDINILLDRLMMSAMEPEPAAAPPPSRPSMPPPLVRQNTEESLRKLLHEKEDEIQQLKEKLEFMEDSKRCKMCMDNEINMVMIPCGHRALCSDCASELQQNQKRDCIICCRHWNSVVRTYDS
eukprot:TRINITY_DN9919_c0_g1_i3.p1 TRINITY_DN9919_c0_g1~~TRINITY_DN9919_c0_g1_i3.p1  ORF type:complete len:152 (-),score=24.79 TRINITY_DN9919_c0_g1_i3:15-470(-)